MSMMRELVRFYGNDTAVTEDEMKLASAAKGLSEEREATAAMAKAEDRVDIQEHIRRFHGGKLEPGESCPFLDKLKKAEEDFGTLDPKDADGDGNSDFPEEEETEEGMKAGNSEDSAIRSYFDSVAKDSFKEEDHPRTPQGGSGGGRFRISGRTIEKEDGISNGPTDEEKEEFLSLYNKMWESSDSLNPRTFRLWEIAEKAKAAGDTSWMGRGPNSVLDVWMQNLDMAKPWVKQSREEQEKAENKAFEEAQKALEGSSCDIDGDYYRAGLYSVHGRNASKNEKKAAYKKVWDVFRKNGVFAEQVFYENDDYPRGVRVRYLTMEK